MPHDFDAFLTKLAERPGIFVGRACLYNVAHFLEGYCFALGEVGLPDPLAGWQRWVEYRFGVFNSAWRWSRILHHFYRTESAAIRALPELYAEFRRDAAAMTWQEMERRLRQTLLERYGEDYYAPPDTHTADFGHACDDHA